MSVQSVPGLGRVPSLFDLACNALVKKLKQDPKDVDRPLPVEVVERILARKDDSLEVVSKLQCPTLSQLDCSNNRFLNYSVLDALMSRFPSIERVNLSGCQGFLFFPSSVESHPKLREIDLRDVPSERNRCGITINSIYLLLDSIYVGTDAHGELELKSKRVRVLKNDSCGRGVLGQMLHVKADRSRLLDAVLSKSLSDPDLRELVQHFVSADPGVEKELLIRLIRETDFDLHTNFGTEEAPDYLVEWAIRRANNVELLGLLLSQPRFSVNHVMGQGVMGQMVMGQRTALDILNSFPAQDRPEAKKFQELQAMLLARGAKTAAALREEKKRKREEITVPQVALKMTRN